MERKRDAKVPPPGRARNLYRETLRPLSKRHRAFVRRVLDGGTLEESARAAGFRSSRGVVYLLGLAPVARALKRLAPLMPDQAAARRALEPLLTARLVDVTERGGHAQRVTAARELSNASAPTVGPGATGRGAPAATGAATWERRRQEAAARREAARAAAGLDEAGAEPEAATAPEPEAGGGAGGPLQ